MNLDELIRLAAVGSASFSLGFLAGGYWVGRRYAVRDYYRLLTIPVPKNKILPTVCKLPLVELTELWKRFEIVHAANENRYNGDGSWGKGMQDPHNFDPMKKEGMLRAIGKHPLLRHTAWNTGAYTIAWSLTSNALYRERALSGVDYLLSKQSQEGYFPYYLEDSPIPTVDQAGVQLVSGWCVAYLKLAYDTFNDNRIIESADRAAWWAVRSVQTPNYNYRANVVWLLVSAYELTGKVEWLDGAVNILRKELLPAQMPDGGWWQHNGYVWYHSYILRAIAATLRQLSPQHPFYPDLEKATIAATNLVVKRQKPDGSLVARKDLWQTIKSPGQPHSAIEAFGILSSVFGNQLRDTLQGMIVDLLRWVDRHPLSVLDAKRNVYSMVLDSHLLALARTIQLYPDISNSQSTHAPSLQSSI